MTIRLNDKVGPKGLYANRHEDVLAIQNAINRISYANGGRRDAAFKPKLQETGIIDEPTLVAIQEFQLENFGWPGADRRVFPLGQTITRINQLLDSEVVPPMELPRSNIFFVRLAQSPLSISQNTYIEIADPSANAVKTYVVTSLFPIPLNAAAYSSPERIMWRGMPVSIDDFENAEFNYSSIATYQTDISVNYKSVNCDNTMRIKLRGGVENSFSMSTYILETYIKALNGRNSGGNGYYSDQIAGHMRSV